MTIQPKTKALTPIEDFRQNLSRMTDQFKAALPSHIQPEKFQRVVMTAIQNAPNLLEADRASLWNACVKCAQEGLLPDGREAALVPFGKQVQYMPMVAGILKKVRNSGELASITAQILHENDKFRYWVDSDGEHLEHEPLMFGDRGARIGVYALAKTKDGSVYVETLTLAQVNDIKKMARSKTVWDGPFADEMWKKTAIRRLSKRLPMSTDLEMTVRADDELYDLKPVEDKPVQDASRLSKLIDKQSEQDAIPAQSGPVAEEDLPL